MKDCMLTTIDNPFDPFTQFDEWLQFDEEKGYYTLQYLARIARTFEGMTDVEMEEEAQNAIDEIVDMNILGIYKKVYKN